MTFEEAKLELFEREEQAIADKNHDPDNEYLEGVADGLHEAAKLVSITDPVKHGRWGHDFYDDGEGGENWFRYCSECEVEVSEENAKLWRYCPNCGARMEESE